MVKAYIMLFFHIHRFSEIMIMSHFFMILVKNSGLKMTELLSHLPGTVSLILGFINN